MYLTVRQIRDGKVIADWVTHGSYVEQLHTRLTGMDVLQPAAVPTIQLVEKGDGKALSSELQATQVSGWDMSIALDSLQNSTPLPEALERLTRAICTDPYLESQATTEEPDLFFLVWKLS